MASPVFYLAFAYHQTEALPEVVNELNALAATFRDAGHSPVISWQVTQREIEQTFDIERERLRIFHFSGHAGQNALQMNNAAGQVTFSFAEGLAGLAGMAPGLRLVFLNGCSTREQAQAFLDKGIAAVIFTTKPLIDRYGLDFARRFYQNFTRSNSKMTLRQAFEAAYYSFIGEHGSVSPEMLPEQVRGSIVLDDTEEMPLYELRLHPAKEYVEKERFADWLELKSGPDYKALKTELQRLIAEARLEEALDKMAPILPEAEKLRATYAGIKKEKLLGLIDMDEWFKHQARTTHAALEFLKML